MVQRTWRIIIGAVAACFAAALLAATVLGGCPGQIETAAGGMVPMKCHGTFAAVSFAAAVGLACAAAALLCRTKEGRRMGAFACLACAFGVVLPASPFGIGLCANAAMPCHATALAVWIAAGAAIVLAVVALAKADPVGAALPKMKL